LCCRSSQESKTFLRFPTKQKPHFVVMGLFALDVVTMEEMSNFDPEDLVNIFEFLAEVEMTGQ
jgi:hypothetical protein